MPDTVTVFCCICGEAWAAGNPAVEYRSLDRRWWCRDETECTGRRARGEAELDAAIGEVLADMEKQGWRF